MPREHTSAYLAGEAPVMSDHAAIGHGGMAHDLGDPALAAAMERAVRNRFFVALLLTIPIVLSSPIGRDLVGVELPSPPGCSSAGWSSWWR